MERTAGKGWLQFGGSAGAASSAGVKAFATFAVSRNRLPRGFRQIFLEDETKPLPLKWGMRLRRATFLFIWVATLLILFAELASRLGPTNDAFSTVLGTVFFTSIHLFYLYLIFFLLILSSLPHRQYKQRVWFPSLFFLYCVVNFLRGFFEYLAFMSDSWFPTLRVWQSPLQYASLTILVFYYFAWLVRDYCKYDTIDIQGRRVNTYWLLVEAASLITLVARIIDLAAPSFFSFLPFRIPPHAETTVIALSLGLWGFLQWYEGSFAERTFRSSYQEYLRQNTSHFDPNILSVPLWQPASVKRILDFGCGDGTRLRENLAWLGLTNFSQFTIHGFDTNSDWESFFLDTFNQVPAIFLSSKHDLNAQNHYDLIVISHCLYDVRALQDVTKFLKQCDIGTKILIRGASPRSFFYFVSRAQALKVLGRAQASYSWHQWALQSLVRDVGLTPLKSGSLGTPDAIVKQTYRLTGPTVEFAAKLLGDLYGGSTKENVSEIFQELIYHGHVTELPNDDLVFMFEKTS